MSAETNFVRWPTYPIPKCLFRQYPLSVIVCCAFCPKLSLGQLSARQVSISPASNPMPAVQDPASHPSMVHDAPSEGGGMGTTGLDACFHIIFVRYIIYTFLLHDTHADEDKVKLFIQFERTKAEASQQARLV